MLLVMCKAVLKSLDWQKESYQMIVLVTDLVLCHSCMYSAPLTQKLELEFTQDLIFYTREWTRHVITINPIRPVPPSIT